MTNITTTQIIPRTKDTVLFIPAIIGDPDIGSLYATQMIMRAIPSISSRACTGPLSTLDFLNRMEALLTKVGAWTFLDPSIMVFLKQLLMEPLTSRSMGGSPNDAVDYDDSNVKEVFSCIQRLIGEKIEATPKARKILRRSSMLARAWADEATIRIYQNLNSQAMGIYSMDMEEILTVAAMAVKDYGEVRGSRLDHSSRSLPALNSSDISIKGFSAFNERILSVVKNQGPSLAEGGPAFDFEGYRINVKTAYAIMAKAIHRWSYLARNNSTMATLEGHFWTNEDRNLPIIGGDGNAKHMKVCRLIQACAKTIAQFHPIPMMGALGIRVEGEWTVNLGEVHDDISINAEINRNIKTCSACGFIHDGSRTMLANGDTLEGHAVTLGGGNMCGECFKQDHVVAMDSPGWVRRSTLVGLEFQFYDSNGRKTSNVRNARCTSQFMDKLTRLSAICTTCGSRAYNMAAMGSYTDIDPQIQALIRTMAQPIPLASELGNRIQISALRSPSTESATLRLNMRAEIWDSGSPTCVCPRCCTIDNLYLDAASGHYYSNIDNSPSAPEYGYKVTDPDGRFLPRCLGIEFETGPGSSGVRNKDEFLNQRCSDGIHIWHIHSDGSLMGDACEITTPPVGGLAVKMAVDAMFELAKRNNFFIENRSAGMHVHTDITDLFMAMMPVRKVWERSRNSPDSKYRRFCKLLGNFGDALASLSRQFVSVYRRHNQYCSGGFGIRSWNITSEDPMACYESTVGTGRQAVCVHMHNGYSKRTKITYTLENRIWPSSNSKEYTLARAELTQKAVDKFCLMAIPFLEASDPTEVAAHHELLKAFVETFTAIAPFTSSHRIPLNHLVTIPDRACDMLGISDEGREGLKKLHKRFFFISYHAYEHGLDMNSAEIVDMRRAALRQAGTSESAVSSIPRADELAGIMLQKGFGDLRHQAHNPMVDAERIVMMDTLVSTISSYNPIATDVSDLSDAAPLTTVHH